MEQLEKFCEWMPTIHSFAQCVMYAQNECIDIFRELKTKYFMQHANVKMILEQQQ